jgi:hypothetical protein
MKKLCDALVATTRSIDVLWYECVWTDRWKEVGEGGKRGNL